MEKPIAPPPKPVSSTAATLTATTPAKKDRVSFREDDNESVISELTTGNDSRRGSMDDAGGSRRASINDPSKAKRRMTRKSIFDTSQMAMNAGNIAGRNLLSGNMLEFIKEDSLEGTAAEALKEESVNNPHAILGWQVSLSFPSLSVILTITFHHRLIIRFLW